MPKKILYITGFILLLSALGTSLESPLRYIKYLLFLLFAYKLIVYPSFKVNKVLVQNFLILSFMLTINIVVIVIKGNWSMRFIEETVLILLPILVAMGYASKDLAYLNKSFNVFFYVYAIAFIVFHHVQLIELSMLLEKIPTALLQSQFQTESWMGFVFALFSLFFFLNKQYKHLIVALILTILAFKRIAIVASLVGIGTYFILFELLKIKFQKTAFRWALLGVNFLLTTLFSFFIDGRLNYYIESWTGLSVNHFSQGRFFIYNKTLNTFDDDLIFGAGLGSTFNYLQIRYPGFDFLHSDFLKIIIEFGIILFLFYIVSIIFVNIKNKKTFAAFLFINVLLFTDNTFIYFDVLFLFYLMLTYFIYEHAKT